MDVGLASVIVACVSFLGNIYGSYKSHQKTQAIQDERMARVQDDIRILSNRVDKHNNLIERMGIVETKINNIERELN